MSLRKLPEIHADARLAKTRFDVRPDAMDKWHPEVHAAADGDASISVYDVIGEGWDGTGVTAKRINGALRNIGAKAVTVNINSPGGDFFEGVAIYNLLRAHPAKVTVNVMGLAASAASVIAMAGDEIRMGDGAFLMIHNAWALAIGNRHDLAAAAEQLAPFDAAMAGVYAARTGKPAADMAALMDNETWLGATDAVDAGFADGVLDRGATAEAGASASASAVRRTEAALRASGMPRSAAQKLISELKSSLSDSAGNAGLSDSAVHDDAAELLRNVINGLKA